MGRFHVLTLSEKEENSLSEMLNNQSAVTKKKLWVNQLLNTFLYSRHAFNEVSVLLDLALT